MKKALSLFLAFIMVFGVVATGIAVPHAHAEEAQQTYTEGDFVYEINTDYNYAIITDFTNKEFTGEIVIPDTLGGYPVRRLVADSFKGCQCTAVSIPASVTYIDPEAFAYDMPNMEKFTVDANNGYYAEYKELGILYRKKYGTASCVNIIAYPKNAPHTSVEFDRFTDVIGAFAFTEVKNLKKVIFAAGYSMGTYYEIESYAFYNAKSIETVEIGNGLCFIGDYAFEGCSSLTSLSFPKKLTGFKGIGWDCFKDTPFINNPENYDEDGVLYLNNHLLATLPEADKEYYAIKPGTNSVAGGAFRWNSLKEVYLPASVEHINSNPFARCANLEKFTADPEGDFEVNDRGVLTCYSDIVAYPNGIYRTCYVVEQEQIEIWSRAFYQSPIKSFYLPANLDYAGIYYLALGGDNVTDIYFEGIEEDWIDDYLYDKKRYEKETTAEEVAEIHFEVYSEDEHNMSVGSDMQTTCSCGYTAEYTPSNGSYAENGFVYDVVDGNAIIKSYLHKDSTDPLVIPETLGGCPVTEIDCEFTDCMFTSVHISSTVTKIREGAFAYALNNEAFTVAEGNEEFSATADGVLLGVTSYAVFAYPPNAPATEYKIPKPVCGIMPYAFCGTKNLKTVTMPSYKLSGQTLYTVGMIFDYAFLNSSVETVYIEGEEFYWMGNGVFKNSQLKEISFVSSTEIFGYEVFEGTPFLENAEYDEDGVFYHQNYLIATDEGTGKTNYDIKDGTTVVAGDAFKWSSLESVNIPASVKCIGSSAFGEAASLKTITVDSSNEYFSVDDYGVLYNKDKTKLVVFPAALENVCYAVPRGVTEIGDFAFGNVQILKRVNIPSDVTAIGENAFGMGDFEHISEIHFEGTKNDWKELRAYDSGLDWARYKSSINKTFNTYTGGEHSTVHTVTDSTCEEVGYEYYTCSCEFQYVVTIPAKGHSAEKEYRVIYEPTCTSSGYSKLYCSRCDKQLNYKYPSALGHDKELIEYIEPTCTETGRNHYRCKRCEIDIYEDVEAALGHSSSEETIKIEPTCTEDGGLYYACERCGEPNPDDCAETYPATGHTEGEWKRTQEATCSKRQRDNIYCTVCNVAISVKYGDYGTHNYIESVIEQTCTYKHSYYYCNGGCGDSYYEEVVSSNDAIFGENELGIGHIVEDVVVDATCTEKGKSYKQCTVCGATVGEVTEGETYGHTWSEAVTQEATCSQEGIKTLTCTLCGTTEEVVIPVIAHTFGDWEYESGNTFSGACSVCGENFDSIEVSIAFEQNEVAIYNQTSTTLSVTVTENISDNIVFTTSDSNIVTVNSSGKITAKALGKAIITATIEGTEITAQCEVTVNARSFGVEWIVDGEIYDYSFIEEGTKLEAPEDPEKAGYVFAGWTPEVPDVMPANNLTFTAVYKVVSQSDDFDVSATYLPGCFNEEITLEVAEIEGDREPGGVYMVEGEYYKQIGLYNIKTANENGDVVQPNEGYTVTIRMAIPEAYKNYTSFMIYHRFTGGGREQLSTDNGTLRVENGYLVFEVSQFSEFELFVPAPSLKITQLPDKTVYYYNTAKELDLTGLRLRYTKSDGTTKTLTDSSPITVTGFDGSKVGTQTVTVKYGQCSDTFEVTVKYNWWQWIIHVLFFGLFTR